MIEDRLVVLFAAEEIERCVLSAGLERLIFADFIISLFVFVGRPSTVSAPMPNGCLAAEIVRPAFRKLRAWNVGLEYFVNGSVVQDHIAGWLVDPRFEGTRKLH